MKTTWFKRAALIGTGFMMAILPGCLEIEVLRWATPFLLHN